MTKKRGDDQYGYDPDRTTARSLFDRLERQAEQRPDKPAKKLGDVLKLPKVKPVERRLLDAHGEIMNGSPMEIVYQHSVLAQTSMPYKPTTARVWERSQGSVSLLIEAGRARHPDTGQWVELPLPHGEKPRLVLMHLNAEALRTGSPIIDVEESMTAFVRSLGIHVNGRNIRTLRDQLARLAAAHIMLGVGPDTIKADIIRQFRVAHIGFWGDFDWAPTGIDQQHLRHAEASNFPRMNTDGPRMNTDRMHVERIGCRGCIQSSIYPCSSVAHPCSSVENLKGLEI